MPDTTSVQDTSSVDSTKQDVKSTSSDKHTGLAKKTALTASTAFSSDSHSVGLTDQSSSIGFKSESEDTTIGGKRFHLSGTRIKNLTPKNSVIWEKTKSVRPNSFEKNWDQGNYGRVILDGIKNFLYYSTLGVASGIESLGRKGITKIQNYINRKSLFQNREHVLLTEKETQEVRKFLNDLWEAYKDKCEIDIKDIVKFDLRVALKDDKELDLSKPFALYAVVRSKDKKGNTKLKMHLIVNGSTVTDPPEKDGDDFLISLGKAIDFSTFNKRPAHSYEEHLKYLKSNTFPMLDETDEKDMKDADDVKDVKKTSYKEKKPEIDPLICYAHASQVLVDATKSEEEFGKKTKIQRDKEATKLKRESFGKEIKQEDAQAFLIKSGLLNKDQFKATRNRYLSGSTESTGNPSEDIAMIPMLHIEDKKPLQDIFDSHFDDHSIVNWKDTRSKSSTKGNILNITRTHTIYTTKPPFLMFGIHRLEKTKTSYKDVPDIELPQHIRLRGGHEITSSAINEKSVIRYSLKGFIHHSGSLNSGHYVTYVLRDIDGQKTWYKYDNLGEYGIKIDEKSNQEFNQRKKQPYICLYINPEEPDDLDDTYSSDYRDVNTS